MPPVDVKKLKKSSQLIAFTLCVSRETATLDGEKKQLWKLKERTSWMDGEDVNERLFSSWDGLIEYMTNTYSDFKPIT